MIAQDHNFRPAHSGAPAVHEPSFDEGSFAHQVAQVLAIPCETVWVQAEDFPRELAGLVARTCEPLADPAWIPTALLARRAARDAKVAFVGEGGDELFGGYPAHIGAHISARYAALPSPVKSTIKSIVERWPPSQKKILPRAVVHRRKRGLSVPLTAWLRGPLYQWAEAQLANPLLEEVGIRRAEAVTLLQEHRQLRCDQALPLWTLLALSEWLSRSASRGLT